MGFSESCGLQLLRLYVAVSSYLRRAWYLLWRDQVWVSWCGRRSRQCNVTLIAPLLRFWVGEKIWNTPGTWYVRHRTLVVSQDVAYRGPLSRAWRIRELSSETEMLHRQQAILSYRGEVMSYDLTILDSWHRLAELYGPETVTDLDQVFAILGWQVDQVTWVLWNPYRTVSLHPSEMALRDLYHDGTGTRLVPR